MSRALGHVAEGVADGVGIVFVLLVWLVVLLAVAVAAVPLGLAFALFRLGDRSR